MTATLPAHPTAVKPRGSARPLGNSVPPTAAEDTQPDSTAAATRHERARTLAALSGGRRDLLEDLRAGYLKRLHRASDDFEATGGLRVVEAALSLIPRSPGPEMT